MNKFDKELFGYDKVQVEKRLAEDAQIIATQKKDIKFLKDMLLKSNENER